ncbi:hypothetical protein FQN52_004985 [Onygenales sp. PD_12]|nr:hypothetical protein FQN52_004985 [Onygenales sp. PD_12]
MSPVTEIIYLTLKPTVKPEDPDNDEGRVFFEAQQAVKQQSGYQSSYWGRTEEDENNVVWIVEWKDTTSSVPLSLLTPILSPSSTPITTHTTLTPPLPTSTHPHHPHHTHGHTHTHAHDQPTLPTTPTTELTILAFPSSLPFAEKSSICTNLSNFRSALLNIPEPPTPTTPTPTNKEEKPPARAPRFFSLGWAERPSTVKHPDSPSGEAELAVMVIGWGSVGEHMAVRATEAFREAVRPLRERMLEGIKVLEMRHVRFLGEGGKEKGE